MREAGSGTRAAMEEFFEEAVGVPYPELIKGRKVGFPTVHVDADFSVPLKYGDVTKVSVTIVKIGRSSVHMRYRVKRQDGLTCAEAHLTQLRLGSPSAHQAYTTLSSLKGGEGANEMSG